MSACRPAKSAAIEQIFRESGEAEFRRAEHAALRELLADLDSSPRVVALGGGAFVQAENAALLAEAAVPVVFLDAPVEELFRRCQQEPVERPLRRNLEEFRQLYLGAAPALSEGGVADRNQAARMWRSWPRRWPKFWGFSESGTSPEDIREVRRKMVWKLGVGCC